MTILSASAPQASHQIQLFLLSHVMHGCPEFNRRREFKRRHGFRSWNCLWSLNSDCASPDDASRLLRERRLPQHGHELPLLGTCETSMHCQFAEAPPKSHSDGLMLYKSVSWRTLDLNIAIITQPTRLKLLSNSLNDFAATVPKYTEHENTSIRHNSTFFLFWRCWILNCRVTIIRETILQPSVNSKNIVFLFAYICSVATTFPKCNASNKQFQIDIECGVQILRMVSSQRV